MAVTKTASKEKTSKAILPVSEVKNIAAAKAEKKTAAPAAKKAEVKTAKAPVKAAPVKKEAKTTAAASAPKAAPAKVSAPVVKAAEVKAPAPVVKAEVKAAPKAEVKTSVKAPVAVKTVAPKKEKGVKKAAPYVSQGKLSVELVHSTASCTKKQIRTVQALGLKKLHDVHEHKDNPAIQGMIKLVAHLVKVEKVS